MANNWMSFRPPRHVAYTALIAVIVAVLAIVYRRYKGDDGIALALGLSAILIGVIAYIMLHVERRRWHRDLVSGSQRYKRLSNRGRKIAWFGAAIVVGSFVVLGAMIWLFGASPEHTLLFQIWLVVFLIGFVLLWFPVITKWGIMLGIISPNGEDE